MVLRIHEKKSQYVYIWMSCGLERCVNMRLFSGLCRLMHRNNYAFVPDGQRPLGVCVCLCVWISVSWWSPGWADQIILTQTNNHLWPVALCVCVCLCFANGVWIMRWLIVGRCCMRCATLNRFADDSLLWCIIIIIVIRLRNDGHRLSDGHNDDMFWACKHWQNGLCCAHHARICLLNYVKPMYQTRL